MTNRKLYRYASDLQQLHGSILEVILEKHLNTFKQKNHKRITALLNEVERLRTKFTEKDANGKDVFKKKTIFIEGQNPYYTQEEFNKEWEDQRNKNRILMWIFSLLYHRNRTINLRIRTSTKIMIIHENEQVSYSNYRFHYYKRMEIILN